MFVTADEIIAIFTIVLAFATIILAVATLGLMKSTGIMAKETELMRKAQETPQIIVTFEMTIQGDAIMYVIENVGFGVAYNIDVNPKQVIRSPSVDITQARYKNLKILKPKEKFRTLFLIVQNQADPLSAKDLVFSEPLEFEIKYNNKDGENYTESQLFDLRRFDSFRPEPKRY